MNDRELLYLAAKAAGMNTAESMWHPRAGFVWVKRGDGIRTENAWNPLTDDGDAFRLMVKFGIEVVSYSDTVAADGIQEDRGADDCQATRRAIVRAAAEIGKEK